jgi:hypothetical protein
LTIFIDFEIKNPIIKYYEHSNMEIHKIANHARNQGKSKEESCPWRADSFEKGSK